MVKYADAGPIGLGYIALARKNPAAALKIFDEYLKINPGMFRFKEATLGKLEAMTELGQLDAAEKLAIQIVNGKSFRGEPEGKVYLLLARIYRKQAEKAEGENAKLECLKKAHAIYQRVYTAYQSAPDVCAEGYLQAYRVAIYIGNKAVADLTLQVFMADTKVANTEAYKKAAAIDK